MGNHHSLLVLCCAASICFRLLDVQACVTINWKLTCGCNSKLLLPWAVKSKNFETHFSTVCHVSKFMLWFVELRNGQITILDTPWPCWILQLLKIMREMDYDETVFSLLSFSFSFFVFWTRAIIRVSGNWNWRWN